MDYTKETFTKDQIIRSIKRFMKNTEGKYRKSEHIQCLRYYLQEWLKQKEKPNTVIFKAECTRGDGPDVIITVGKEMFDLTADEAIRIGYELINSAKIAKQLDTICKDHDIENCTKKENNIFWQQHYKITGYRK